MLSDSRMNQILQTAMDRLDDGIRGAPQSYSEEEKEYYLQVEADIIRNREQGFKGTYSIPSD